MYIIDIDSVCYTWLLNSFSMSFTRVTTTHYKIQNYVTWARGDFQLLKPSLSKTLEIVSFFFVVVFNGLLAIAAAERFFNVNRLLIDIFFESIKSDFIFDQAGLTDDDLVIVRRSVFVWITFRDRFSELIGWDLFVPSPAETERKQIVKNFAGKFWFFFVKHIPSRVLTPMTFVVFFMLNFFGTGRASISNTSSSDENETDFSGMSWRSSSYSSATIVAAFAGRFCTKITFCCFTLFFVTPPSVCCGFKFWRKEKKKQLKLLYLHLNV